MKSFPRSAWLLAAGAMLVVAIAARPSEPAHRHRVALSLSLEQGHFKIAAELGALLVVLGS